MIYLQFSDGSCCLVDAKLLIETYQFFKAILLSFIKEGLSYNSQNLTCESHDHIVCYSNSSKTIKTIYIDLPHLSISAYKFIDEITILKILQS